LTFSATDQGSVAGICMDQILDDDTRSKIICRRSASGPNGPSR
jgi:hypothetical protein